MEESGKVYIECETHGKQGASIVCTHYLSANVPLGFIENVSEPNDLQGWCYACEHMYAQEKKMTNKFKKFNSAKVVCEKCYHEIKEKNTVHD